MTRKSLPPKTGSTLREQVGKYKNYAITGAVAAGTVAISQASRFSSSACGAGGCSSCGICVPAVPLMVAGGVLLYIARSHVRKES